MEVCSSNETKDHLSLSPIFQSFERFRDSGTTGFSCLKQAWATQENSQRTCGTGLARETSPNRAWPGLEKEEKKKAKICGVTWEMPKSKKKMRPNEGHNVYRASGHCFPVAPLSITIHRNFVVLPFEHSPFPLFIWLIPHFFTFLSFPMGGTASRMNVSMWLMRKAWRRYQNKTEQKRSEEGKWRTTGGNGKEGDVLINESRHGARGLLRGEKPKEEGQGVNLNFDEMSSLFRKRWDGWEKEAILHGLKC